MIRRIVSEILYIAAAAAIANWIDIIYGAFWEPYGSRLRAPEILALVGACLLAMGSLVTLFSARYGGIIGVAASGLSWVYFAPAAMNVPFFWSSYGGAMPIACLILLAASVWSVVSVISLLRAAGKRQR